MELSELIKRVKLLISNNEVKESLDLLIENIDDEDPFNDDLISIKRRYLTLHDENEKGRLNSETYQVETNKFLDTYLSLLKELEVREDKKIEITNDFISGSDSHGLKSQLLEYIKKAQIERAFNLIRKWLEFNETNDEKLSQQIELLSSRFNQVRNNRRKGTISIETAQLEENKIIASLLSLVDKIIEAPEKEKEKKEKQEQIQSSAASFVQESISELSNREQRLKNQAMIWYVLGFLSLIGGIAAAIILISTGSSKLESTIGIVYIILKSLFIIGLLVAASRYAFNLGKTYMNESLKNADRIHAISFGKFYLQVFGANIEPDDLKDVFKDWNTSKESPFIKLDSSEFDPQLLQAFMQFTALIKGDKK